MSLNVTLVSQHEYLQLAKHCNLITQEKVLMFHHYLLHFIITRDIAYTLIMSCFNVRSQR